jgi:death on curing protein
MSPTCCAGSRRPWPILPSIEPVWIESDFAIAFNRTLAPHCTVLKPRELESALARPRHLFDFCGEDDLATLAAAITAGIARNHPFTDGNKRTALACAVQFIESNGYAFNAPDNLGEAVESLTDGHLSEADFAAMLAAGVVA